MKGENKPKCPRPFGDVGGLGKGDPQKRLQKRKKKEIQD